MKPTQSLMKLMYNRSISPPQDVRDRYSELAQRGVLDKGFVQAELGDLAKDRRRILMIAEFPNNTRCINAPNNLVKMRMIDLENRMHHHKHALH